MMYTEISAEKQPKTVLFDRKRSAKRSVLTRDMCRLALRYGAFRNAKRHISEKQTAFIAKQSAFYGVSFSILMETEMLNFRVMMDAKRQKKRGT